MKIIVDAFGGDNAPLEILKACAEAVTDFDIDILLSCPFNFSNPSKFIIAFFFFRINFSIIYI